MKLKEKDIEITYLGHTGTIHHKPTGLRAIREHRGPWHKNEFEDMLKQIMARMISTLDDQGNYLPQCKHCLEPVEAKHYTMCKKCWWERDPRNPVNVRASVLQTLMDNMPPHCDMGHKGCPVVHQNSGLSDETESKYIRIVEDYRRSMCCSLDEAIARCYTSEMSSIPFKKWLFTLAVDIVY